MTAAEILKQLQALGQESYKKVLLKHDIKEPVYGVKIEELQKIRKKIKNGHELSLKLYDTGIYDAMYLAGLIAEPEKMTVKDLQKWAENATAPVLREYTVAWVSAESGHGMKKAMEWIKDKDADIVSTGWATLANIVAITDDSELDIPLLTKLLKEVAKTIDKSPNRVKQTMNAFVIAVGTYVKELNPVAKQTGLDIGKVKVDMGDTACKVPYSVEYIEKAEKKNTIGKKKKSARCL
ncbi:MAG: DNA alkylation repair protein [Bacteroidota bacterium]